MVATVEALIYANRMVLFVMAAVLTLALGYAAATADWARPDLSVQSAATKLGTGTGAVRPDSTAPEDEIAVAVRGPGTTIWSKDGFSAIAAVQNALVSRPGIAADSVVSILSPNIVPRNEEEESFVLKIRRLMSITPDYAFSAEDIALLRRWVGALGLEGHLVSRDGSSILIRVLVDRQAGTFEPEGLQGDLNAVLHAQPGFDAGAVLVAGYPLNDDRAVVPTHGLPRLLLVIGALGALAVLAGCRSLPLTAVSLGCVGLGLLWSAGAVALLAPSGSFSLAAALGTALVSGLFLSVLVTSAIATQACSPSHRQDPARIALRHLLRPLVGAMAIAGAASAALLVLPIDTARDAIIPVVVSVLAMVVSVVVLLPLMANFLHFGEDYIAAMNRVWVKRQGAAAVLSVLSRPGAAGAVLSFACVVTVAALVLPEDRKRDFETARSDVAPASAATFAETYIADTYAFSPETFAVRFGSHWADLSDGPDYAGLNLAADEIRRKVASIPGIDRIASVDGIACLNVGAAIATGAEPGGLVRLGQRTVRPAHVFNPDCSTMTVLASAASTDPKTLRSFARTMRSDGTRNTSPWAEFSLTAYAADAGLHEGGASLDTVWVDPWGGSLGTQAYVTDSVMRHEGTVLIGLCLIGFLIVSILDRSVRGGFICMLPIAFTIPVCLWLMDLSGVPLTEVTLSTVVFVSALGGGLSFAFYQALVRTMRDGYRLGDAMILSIQGSGSGVLFMGLAIGAGGLMLDTGSMALAGHMAGVLTILMATLPFAILFLIPAGLVAADRIAPVPVYK